MMSGIGIDFLRLVFDLVLLLLLLRLLLQLTRADFYNPLSQAVVRITSPLDPLRRALGARGGLDLATLLALLAVQGLKIALVWRLAMGGFPSAATLLAGAGVSLLDLLATFYFWGIIIVIVISWVAPNGPNPVGQLLYSITEPVLGPARRLLPPMGGIDFSPMLVMFGLHVVRAYLIPALAQATGAPLF